MDTEKQNLKYVQVSLRELSRKQSELHYKKRLQESNDEEEKSRLRLMIAMSKIEIRPAILNYLDLTSVPVAVDDNGEIMVDDNDNIIIKDDKNISDYYQESLEKYCHIHIKPSKVKK